MPLPLDITTVSELHLEEIVKNRAIDGTRLDLKATLPDDAAKSYDFLSEVGAFANGVGGDIIFGVSQDTQGNAQALTPLGGDLDAGIEHLREQAALGIEPPVPGLLIEKIALSAGYAIIVRVPQSWDAPHRIRSSQRFYIRVDGHRREMAVPELSGLFARSDHQRSRVDRFRSLRLGKLLAREGPYPLGKGVKVIAHLVPTTAALGQLTIDPAPYAVDRSLPLLTSVTASMRMTADGALAISNATEGVALGYSLLFRNGFFEAVRVLPFEPDGKAILNASKAEAQFIDLLSGLRKEFRYLGVTTEISCFLSVLDADRVSCVIDGYDKSLEEHQGRFDRASLLLPGVLLAEELTAAQALKPLFDLTWQSAGFEGSRSYNAEGQWRPGLRYH